MEISKEFAQQILNYLAQRPYAEVYELIAALVALKEEDKPDGDKP